MTTAYVLGGGGLLGAHEAGLLRALAEAGIRPDIVVGASIGAVNGVFVAADPDRAAERLGDLWRGESLGAVFSETILGRAVRLTRSGTHLHAIEPLHRLLAGKLPARDFIDLKLPFHCVAASIESATARWFSSGPLIPAVMAPPPTGATRRCCVAGHADDPRSGRSPAIFVPRVRNGEIVSSRDYVTAARV